MDIIEELKQLGANTDEGLARFLNKTELYKKMLLKFPSNIESLEVIPFIEAGDLSTALANAHTIKGITGNLSLTPLYKQYTEIVVQFRADNPDEAKRLLLEILPVQEKFISCIKKYC